MTLADRDLVPITEMSAAVDEIYLLRSLLAYEAAVREADLDLASFPKSRRRYAEESVQRMRAAACGDRSLADNISGHSLESARRQAGMGSILTRPSWLSERGLPVSPVVSEPTDPTPKD